MLEPDALAKIRTGLNRADLVLVAGPGGAGKTTLVAAALAGAERTVAWVRLDEWDDAPATLVDLIVTAIAHAAPESVATAAGLNTAAMDLPPQQALGALINELSAGGSRVALAFDDLHHIVRTDSLKLVRYLIERSGPALAVVVTTRRPSSEMGIERLRAAGRVVDISDADLRLDHDRTAVLLNDRLGGSFDEAALAEILDVTAGWPVAVRAISRTAAPLSNLPTEMGAFMSEVVLAGESEDTRRFMRRTAVLDELTPEACNAVAEVTDAAARIEGLKSRLAFLIQARGHGSSASLGYHDLLRDRLRNELRGDASEWRDAHRRAARHATGTGAVEHLLQAGDQQAAADALVAFVRPRLAGHLPVERVLGWIERLSGATRAEQPWVDLVAAIVLNQQGRFSEAVPLLERLYHHRNSDYELEFMVTRHLHLATGDHARFGPVVAQLRRDQRFDRLPPVVRVESLIASAWGSLWSGDVEAAASLAAAAVDVTQREVDLHAAESLALHFGGPLAAVPGGFDRFVSYHRWALATLPGSPQVRVGASVMLRTARLTLPGLSLPELRPAEEELLGAVALWGVNDGLCEVAELRVRGDAAGADRRCHRLWHERDRNDAWVIEVLASSLGTWASILRELGRPDQIAELEAELAEVGATRRGRPIRLDLVQAVVSAQRSWAAGDRRAAATLLVDHRPAFINPVTVSPAVEHAVLLHEMGDPRAAVAAIAPVLAETARTGVLSAVALSGRPVLPLLRAVTGSHRETAGRIAALLEKPSTPPAAPVAIPGSAEQLSPREMEVLLELATGATNAEVAERLFVSENTVKTHVKRILAKLDARSRTEAVANARHHRLI